MRKIVPVMLCCLVTFSVGASAKALVIDESFDGLGPFSVINPSAGPPRADADYNNDAHTNAADYTVFRDSLGMTGPDLDADGDDGTGTGTTDEIVDAFDYDYWKNNYGGTNELFGFHDDGWSYLGKVENAIGVFNTVDETFDVAQQISPFTLNDGTQGIYQMFTGLGRIDSPVGGRVEWLIEFENIQVADEPNPPGPDVTLYNQSVLMQMNFGNVNLNPGPLNLEFMHIELARMIDGEWTLNFSPLLDNALVGEMPVKDLRTEGWLGADEEVEAIDLKIVIDSDDVNGGSTVELFHDINNSGTFTEFHSGEPGDSKVDGFFYSTDLATEATAVQLISTPFSNVFTVPGSPDPELLGPGLSFDRYFYSTPDPVELASGATIPEPAGVALIFVAACMLAPPRRRTRP